MPSPWREKEASLVEYKGVLNSEQWWGILSCLPFKTNKSSPHATSPFRCHRVFCFPLFKTQKSCLNLLPLIPLPSILSWTLSNRAFTPNSHGSLNPMVKSQSSSYVIYLQHLSEVTILSSLKFYSPLTFRVPQSPGRLLYHKLLFLVSLAESPSSQQPLNGGHFTVQL